MDIIINTQDLLDRYEQAMERGLQASVQWDAAKIETAIENLEWFLGWLEQRYGGKAKRAKSSPCHARLYKGKRCPDGCTTRCFDPRRPHQCCSPDADHSALWLVRGKAVALTSEPYNLDSELPREQAWAEAHGFDVHVFPNKSFWNPGNTNLIVFTAKQDGWLPVLV